MASGYGLRGGIGRCYPFYADFKKCMVSIRNVLDSFLRGTRRILPDSFSLPPLFRACAMKPAIL